MNTYIYIILNYFVWNFCTSSSFAFNDDPTELQTLTVSLDYNHNHGNMSSKISQKNSNHTSITSDELNNLLDDSNEMYSFPMKILLSTLATTTSLVTISGNLLVIFSFFIDRQIRNPTNYFLLSLSISDFLIGLFSIPLYTLYLMLGKWPFGQIICNLWLSLDYTVCLTSIYTVLFITIDRFCSVKIPAKYRKWRSREKILTMIILTWVIPVLLFFTSIFSFSYFKDEEFDPYNCNVGWSDNVMFAMTLAIGYFWITLFVMIVLYCFIYQVAKNLEKKSRHNQKKISTLVKHTPRLIGGQNQICEEKTQINQLKTEPNQNTVNVNQEYVPGKSVKKKDITKMGKIGPSNNSNDEKIKSDNLLTNEENSSDSTLQDTDNLVKNTSLEMEEKDTSFRRYREYSREDEFSSSFDSHSDYEISRKKLAFKDAIKKGLNSLASSNANSLNKISLSKTNMDSSFQKIIDEQAKQQPKELQPRPETLAILSTDMFAEKCEEKKSFEKASGVIEQNNISGTEKENVSQIPFIEDGDDSDDVSYILHRRQFGNKEINKKPISEETIVIKKAVIFQKLATPLKTNNSANKKKNSLTNNKETNKINENNNEETTKNDETNADQKMKLVQLDASNKTTTTHNNYNHIHNKNNNIITNNKNEISVKNNSIKQMSPKASKLTHKSISSSTNNISTSASNTSKNPEKVPLVKLTVSNSKTISIPSVRPLTLLQGKPKSKTKYENRARKALRTITFILGAFVFCWAPFHIVGIFDLFKNDICEICFANSKFYRHFFNTTYFLCYLNSPINPFCYALANQQFKKTFSRILKGDWRRT